MGSNDIPPADRPAWLIPLSLVFLGLGCAMWSAAYVLMTIRSFKTKSYSMPIFALSLDLGWELVYAFYVSEMPLEYLGFGTWLVLDMGLLITTLKFGRYEWEHSPAIGRHLGALILVMTAFGIVGNYAFASWWLSEPGRGFGDKTGKFWGGREGHDCTELAYWSAAALQVPASAGSLAMLLVRGHSGGASYTIWLLRTMGSLFGLPITTGLLWYYWPEAHGFFLNPFGLFLIGASLACDAVYPFVLSRVRRSERELADGRLIRGEVQHLQTKKDT